jgi:hypothetical protein
LYVNRGLGSAVITSKNWRFPTPRIGVAPEVTVFTLVRDGMKSVESDLAARRPARSDAAYI